MQKSVFFTVITLKRLHENRFTVPKSLLDGLETYNTVYGQLVSLLTPRRYDVVFDFAAFAPQGDFWVFDLELVERAQQDLLNGKVYVPLGAVTGTLLIFGEDYQIATELYIDSVRFA